MKLLLTLLLPLIRSHMVEINIKVGVYFGNWKVYGRNYTLCNLPGDKIDVIYYSFLNPTTGVCQLSDSWADTERPFANEADCAQPNQGWDSPLKGNFYRNKFKQNYSN